MTLLIRNLNFLKQMKFRQLLKWNLDNIYVTSSYLNQL